jgi:ABC-type uncharacterized transport system ATPase subunit
LRQDASEWVLIQMMFEKELSEYILRTKVDRTQTPILELVAVNTHAEGAAVSLKNLDLTIYPEEILGVAGVSGNGQRELFDVILGVEKIASGKKLLFGVDVTNKSAGVMRESGLSFIPENPLSMAIVPYMSVLENMALTRTRQYSNNGGWGMDWNAVRVDTQKTLDQFGFAFSIYMPAKTLSGGNLQRLVIVREMMHTPRLIVASYLTRGLDVDSALTARQILVQARNDGAGVLLVSEDLEELFSLSDRIVVLYGGKIAGEFKPTETDVFHIGHLMTGATEYHDLQH